MVCATNLRNSHFNFHVNKRFRAEVEMNSTVFHLSITEEIIMTTLVPYGCPDCTISHEYFICRHNWIAVQIYGHRKNNTVNGFPSALEDPKWLQLYWLNQCSLIKETGEIVRSQGRPFSSGNNCEFCAICSLRSDKCANIARWTSPAPIKCICSFKLISYKLDSVPGRDRRPHHSRKHSKRRYIVPFGLKLIADD